MKKIIVNRKEEVKVVSYKLPIEVIEKMEAKAKELGISKVKMVEALFDQGSELVVAE